ncbi:MAG: hypothetical protein WB239_04145 [Acidimicrobiia bacterium]
MRIKKSDGTYHVGITVSKGPGTYRLLLTRPYIDEGQVIEIPLEEITEVEEAREGPLDRPPRLVGEG